MQKDLSAHLTHTLEQWTAEQWWDSLHTQVFSILIENCKNGCRIHYLHQLHQLDADKQ